MIQLDLFKEDCGGNVISQLTMEVDGIEFASQCSISPLTYESHLKYGTLEDLDNFIKDRLKRSIISKISEYYEKKLEEWI